MDIPELYAALAEACRTEMCPENTVEVLTAIRDRGCSLVEAIRDGATVPEDIFDGLDHEARKLLLLTYATFHIQRSDQHLLVLAACHKS